MVEDNSTTMTVLYEKNSSAVATLTTIKTFNYGVMWIYITSEISLILSL